MRIRTRLTLISAAMMTLLLVVAGISVYLVFRAQVMDAVDAGLSSRTDQLVAALEGGTPAQVPLGAGVIESDEAFAQVLDADGSVVESSPGVAAKPIVDTGELPQSDSSIKLTRTVATDEEPIPARLLLTPTEGGDTVVVGASLEDINEQLASLVRIAAVAAVLAIALTAGIGWAVAGSALRPVESMRVQADEMSVTDLHKRLAVPNTGDELSRLAETLNSLLAEIESALARERTFIGQASHELRTPLANLKAEVDLALRRPRDEAELRDALVSVTEEVNRLSALANALLDLARLGQGQWALRVEAIDPHELVRAEVGRCTARAQQRSVEVVLDCRSNGHPVALRADPSRLQQVVSNLLDNAIAHSPGGSEVMVTSDLGDGWSLQVADAGPGFSTGDVETLTRPFGSDSSHATGSAGLGLSIVRAIVEAHDGSLTLQSRQDGSGAVVTVTLP